MLKTNAVSSLVYMTDLLKAIVDTDFICKFLDENGVDAFELENFNLTSPIDKYIADNPRPGAQLKYNLVGNVAISAYCKTNRAYVKLVHLWGRGVEHKFIGFNFVIHNFKLSREECIRIYIRYEDIPEVEVDVDYVSRICHLGDPLIKSKYLLDKKLPVENSGLFQMQKGLIIPMFDTDGRCCSAQFIYDTEPGKKDNKRFRIGHTNSEYYTIVDYGKERKPLALCEGWATAAAVTLGSEYTGVFCGSADSVGKIHAKLKSSVDYADNIYIIGENDQASHKAIAKVAWSGTPVLMPQTRYKDFCDQWCAGRSGEGLVPYECSEHTNELLNTRENASSRSNMTYGAELSEDELATLKKELLTSVGVSASLDECRSIRFFFVSNGANTYILRDGRISKVYLPTSSANHSSNRVVKSDAPKLNGRKLSKLLANYHDDVFENMYDITYAPSTSKDRVIVEHGFKYLNVYTRPDEDRPSPEAERHVRLFKDLLTYITDGNPAAANYLEKWAAFIWGNPGELLLSAPYLISQAQGTGKNLFTTILARVLGEYNSESPRFEDIFDSDKPGYNSVLISNQLVVFDESYMSRSSFNRFKDIFTNPKVVVKKRYMDEWTANRTCNFILTSNLSTCGAGVELGDRRLKVILNHALTPALGSAEFFKFGKKILQEECVQDIRAYLSTIKISAEELHSLYEDSEAKAQLTLDLTQDAECELTTSILSAGRVAFRLGEFCPPGYNQNRAGEVVRSLGYVKTRLIISTNKYVTAWVHRRFTPQVLKVPHKEVFQMLDKKTLICDAESVYYPGDPGNTPNSPGGDGKSPIEGCARGDRIGSSTIRKLDHSGVVGEEVAGALVDQVPRCGICLKGASAPAALPDKVDIVDTLKIICMAPGEGLTPNEDNSVPPQGLPKPREFQHLDPAKLINTLMPTNPLRAAGQEKPDSVFLDIETYSECDISYGPTVYAQHESTKILCVAYAINQGPVELWTPDMDFPEFMINPQYYKHYAFNVNFEWSILYHQVWKSFLSLEDALNVPFFDVAKLGVFLGYPSSLAGLCSALHLGEDESKLETGRDLIKAFCSPRVRKSKRLDSLDISELYDYCARDVEAMLRCLKLLCEEACPGWRREEAIGKYDLVMNVNPILIDTDRLKVVAEAKNRLVDSVYSEFIELTGGIKPTEVAQIRRHLLEEYDLDMPTFGAQLVYETLKGQGNSLPEGAKRLLQLRLDYAKNSLAKVDIIEDYVDLAGGLTDQFRYFGAHTGRWAGRGVQLQNLPRPEGVIDDEFMASLAGDGVTTDRLKSALRGLIIPPKGYKFLIADLASIEARVLAYLAGQDEVVEAFAKGEDVYKLCASNIFNIPLAEVTKDQRTVGKILTLSLGYQMGAPKLADRLVAFGVFEKGNPNNPGEAAELVKKWRAANRKIVQYWRDTYGKFKSRLSYDKRFLSESNEPRMTTYLDLISGRRLYYRDLAYRDDEQFGQQVVVRGSIRGFYGGSLVENVVQATARDVLVELILRARNCGYYTAFHVHDEVVIQVPDGDVAARDKLSSALREEITWAPGLPIALEWSEMVERYGK